VGEAFLLIFNVVKIHQKCIKWITNWYGCVLLDLKNPTQLKTLKKVERSSWKWPPKLASSMASLHKNGISFQTLQHYVVMNLLVLSKTSIFFIYLEFGVIISQLPPKIWPQKGSRSSKKAKIHKNQAYISKNIQTLGKQNPFGKKYL
jgi:hypothetical protein